MRYSIKEDDSGYSAHFDLLSSGHKLAITLDGYPLRDVLTVDDVIGEALVLIRDESGNLVANGDEVMTTWVRGKIELKVNWARG